MTGTWLWPQLLQKICRVYGIALAGLTLVLGCSTSPTSMETPACTSPHLPRPDLPEKGISAHRGGKLGCPDNTHGAFERAICSGVHQIELDVRATADEKLVVAHDDHVTDKDGLTLTISESTLTEVQNLQIKPCEGETKKQHIPTLEETLRIMPHNIWINLDIKENNPAMGKRVAETVAQAGRFSQVIFAARDKTGLAIRRVAKETGEQSWVSNMNRHLFRCLYVDSTISSCDEFIQFLWLYGGRPGNTTIARLKQAGVRVNYSWLDDEDQGKLYDALDDLFRERKVDFVLVDHVAQAMKAACALDISPVVPRWDGEPGVSCPAPPRCPSTR